MKTTLERKREDGSDVRLDIDLQVDEFDVFVIFSAYTRGLGDHKWVTVLNPYRQRVLGSTTADSKRSDLEAIISACGEKMVEEATESAIQKVADAISNGKHTINFH